MNCVWPFSMAAVLIVFLLCHSIFACYVARAFCSDAETGFIKRPKDPYDPAKPGRPIVRLLDISRLDLRVGKITTVAKVRDISPYYVLHGCRHVTDQPCSV